MELTELKCKNCGAHEFTGTPLTGYLVCKYCGTAYLCDSPNQYEYRRLDYPGMEFATMMRY